MLATDPEVGAGRPGPSEIKLLIHAMPFTGIHIARRERVDTRACHDGDVGDDEARVVGGHVAMDGIRKHSVIPIEEEDNEECEGRNGGELDGCPDLYRRLVSFGSSPRAKEEVPSTYNASRHDEEKGERQATQERRKEEGLSARDDLFAATIQTAAELWMDHSGAILGGVALFASSIRYRMV